MTPFIASRTIPLYGGVLYLAFGDTLAECMDVLPKRCNGLFTKDELAMPAAAMTKGDENGGGAAIIFMRDHVKFGVVAHEAVHAALSILASAGVGPMDDKNDEAYAYLVTWIVEEVEKVVKRNKQLNKRSK